MKLYMTESSGGDYCVFFLARPRREGNMWLGSSLFAWPKSTVNEMFNSTKKLPTGAQVVVVHLEMK